MMMVCFCLTLMFVLFVSSVLIISFIHSVDRGVNVFWCKILSGIKINGYLFMYKKSISIHFFIVHWS
jgi:hypothetical protein